MKKLLMYFAVFAMSWLSGTAAAEDYLMPQWGYEEKTIATGESLTFYDFKGEADIPSASSSNSYSTIVFKPAEAGYGVNIAFDYIEVEDDGSGWVSYLDIFDGVFDKTLVNGGSYPSSVSGSTTPFSQLSTPLKHYENGKFSNETFQSSDGTGALSVCFHYRYAGASRGWKATVTTVKLQDMELKSATAVYDFVNSEIWAGKQDVALAGLNIVAEGGGNPDAVQTITFTLTGTDVIDVSKLAVYAGKAANVSGLTNTEAVITENEGVYTATLNKTLGNGNNYFTIGGAILSSAAFNATASVNVTGIATAGGFTAFTPAAAVTLTVQPMYLMATDATYSIAQDTKFYDEGGKDGNVVKGFDGKVVFAPATDGKKVQLTFKEIDVFYTDYAANSTGYVDYIKVYNGNSTDEKDLLWQLTQAEASSKSDIVIKSTAADGKLTITHKNNVSYDSNLKAGWEAVVSEFTPQAMTVSALNLTKSTGTVSAGTENAQVASVKITTTETEPALSVASLSLNTNDTYSQIAKVKLYYTKDNAFATTHLIGEAIVESNTVTITKSADVAFREGENYLWLVGDISSLSTNDEKVNVTLTNLTFTNGTSVTDFGVQSGELTIKNVAVQACGTQTFTVLGDWAYTHTITSEYNSKYTAEQCDQTVVFKPATAGHVIQIDYADFDVYYASSSYSTRAKYIVYDGEGTSGTILWQLDANGKKPTQLRSTTGAMTIVFNPNTTASYYTGNGWHATVKEYKLQNMVLETATVEQASTKLVQLGEQKAALLDINLQTLGTLNPLTVDALTVDMKGTENNVNTVYLLQGENVLAQAAAAAQVTLTLETPATLAEYDNAFVVVADIKADATVETAVDAAIKSITLSGNAQTVADGDPEGSRTVKNVRYLQAGDNGTVTIGENSLMFYDDGGADENYTANFEGYITFVPATEGYAVELVFKDFDVAYLSGDPFHIYYANAYDIEATSDKKYGMYSKPAENESVISRAADGSLTVYVKMPSSRMRGFEVEVRQHLLTNLTVDSVLVTPMAPAEATKGTGDIRLMRAAVYVSGDRTPLTITAFEQTTSDLLIDRHIYATGHSTTFSTANEFTDSYVMDEKGVYYFWFVGSVDADAEVGNVVSLTLDNVVLGEQKIAPQGTAAVSINVVSGAHGFYRVGASALADYPTLTAALQAISTIGMDGAVEIAVEPGTYTEQVTVPEINGAGAANTITIRSLSGKYNDVTYQYNNTLTAEKGVFTIDGADYVTLKGLSFTSTYTSNQSPAVVIVRNAATHVTIDSCRIYAERMTEYTMRLDLLSVDAGENNYNNDFALTNSVLEGGYMGLHVTGHKAAADPLQQNMLISRNTFRNQGNQMLYGDAVSKLQVLNNTFRAEVKKSNCAAIDWLLIGDTTTIAGNDIYMAAEASDGLNYQALYFRPNSYQDKENAVLFVINNTIYAANASTYASYAVNLNSNLPKLLVAHNTIVLHAEGTAASPVYIQSAPVAGSVFVNNIIQASSKGYAIRYRNAGAIANIAFRHNILYTPEATFGMPTANVSTFADWKTAVGATDEDGNLNEAVTFASATLLIPKETNEGRLLTAEVMASVTTDITGKERAAVPTIGAYEYDADLFRVPALAEGYPAVLNVKDSLADIVVKADNIGTARVLVLAADAEAPGVETVIAQGAELTLQKDAEASITIKGLNEETAYKAYVVTLSPLGDAAAAVTATESFTTLWTLRPVVLNAIAKQTVSADAALTLTATLATEYEQAKPYTYSWRTAFSNDEIGNEATLNINATRATEYICHVTDRFGQDAYVSAHVLVETTDAATFEEYTLPQGGHKMVDQAWADGVETALYSGGYAFANVPNKAYNAFNGYVISADRSNQATGKYMTDQFRSAAGGAYEGNNFAVAYYSAPSTWYAGYKDPISLTYTAARTVTGFYVTNSAYTMDAILHGDYANEAFGEGDYLSLTVKGYNGETATGEVVFYLADYRSADENDHFALAEWKWLDLSSLGAVTRLEFEMYTTKSDAYGFTTPTYFCLDNFGGVAPSQGTGVGNTFGNLQPVKRIESGMLYIVMPDGKQFNAQGELVK